MRQIVLDTETTGISPKEHRIIEIGCVELIDREQTDHHFQEYLQPDREIEAEAIKVHGISNEFLLDKPRFGDIVDQFIDYVKGAELIIHNAPFDVGFLNMEFAKAGKKYGKLEDICTITDTLVMARKKHPKQRNSLDALCKRYFIDNSARTKHGALLDSEILAEVYLAMTGGQKELNFASNDGISTELVEKIRRLDKNRPALNVIQTSMDELSAHQNRLIAIEKAAETLIWK